MFLDEKKLVPRRRAYYIAAIRLPTRQKPPDSRPPPQKRTHRTPPLAVSRPLATLDTL